MNRPIGKYADYREAYLKEVKPEYYGELVTHGELNRHLQTICNQAQDMKELIIDNLKNDSSEWHDMENCLEEFSFIQKLQLLNQFEMIADEYICRDIIYC